MSLRGNINKVSGDIRRSISQIARFGLTEADGCTYGTKKIMGYVCAIHEDGDLAGTVDVQEFNYEPGEYSYEGAGHHEGVLLSAIQNNTDGVLIVPMLFSEVVIIQNPLDGKEYVIMYSHAKTIRLSATSQESDKGEIEIGVKEVKDYTETDEGLEKDYDELEPTKNKATTKYTSTSITDQITSPEDEEGFREECTAERKTITVGETKIVIDGTSINIETSSNTTIKIGSTEISEEEGAVKIKTDTAKIETSNCEIKGSDIKINGGQVTLTGGNLKTQGVAGTDLNGPYNAIKVCPFSGAPHCGSTVSGT